jgi:hypothetical protein
MLPLTAALVSISLPDDSEVKYGGRYAKGLA